MLSNNACHSISTVSSWSPLTTARPAASSKAMTIIHQTMNRREHNSQQAAAITHNLQFSPISKSKTRTVSPRISAVSQALSTVHSAMSPENPYHRFHHTAPVHSPHKRSSSEHCALRLPFLPSIFSSIAVKRHIKCKTSPRA